MHHIDILAQYLSTDLNEDMEISKGYEVVQNMKIFQTLRQYNKLCSIPWEKNWRRSSTILVLQNRDRNVREE